MSLDWTVAIGGWFLTIRDIKTILYDSIDGLTNRDEKFKTILKKQIQPQWEIFLDNIISLQQENW